MKKWFHIFILSVMACLGSACSEQTFSNDAEGNFDALWTILDEHYTFFEYKNVDWDAVGKQYRAKITRGINSGELFNLCSDMLKELKDGHTNLINASDVSRYWIWEKYPINYDERLIDEHYLNFEYKRTSGIKYQILSSNIGYMYYGDFSNGIGEGNLDNVLATLALADGLIIDVRDNGGGIITNAETLVARFIDKRILAGYISHKTGSGHDDFSEPYAYYIDPAKGRVHWTGKPIAVLTNRSTYSAANNFVSIMKSLPNVVVVGDATGGGCGMPFTSELPNGWSVRFSAAPIYDADRQLTEFGVQPTDGCQTDMTDADRQRGVDTIIERAFEALTDMQR